MEPPIYHGSQAVRESLESVNQGFEESNWKITCIRFAPKESQAEPN
ncbi:MULTISPECIES: hypothetical protein [unclassified Coleofasciculus]|nr:MULTISPECIES: hypothetical protein [unclassified Coleofasciculus]